MSVNAGRTLTRRELLAGGGALGVAAALGIATAGSPFAGGSQTVTFWHLFSGGDGIRMTQMLSALAKKDRKLDVRPLILPWGNPYYTKLSLAASGGSPPDVAILHATKLAEFAPAGLLEPLPQDLLERHGLTPDRFLPKPWASSRYQGKQYAIPLDTHPFVLYLNTAMAKKAGVLGKPLNGPDALLDAFDAVKKATGKAGVIFETRGVTPWRLFLTLYSQLGGKPILTDLGKRIDLDEAKALQALEWIGQPAKRGSGGQDVDYQASVALFGDQEAGFLLNGEWEVSTYQADKIPFDMRPIPAIFNGSPATQADSHTFVLPRKPRSRGHLDATLRMIATLLDESLTWAQGGHVPAFKPVFQSAAYRKLQPQSHYAAAADHVVYDPFAWYSGSGSDLEAQAGAAFQPVATGVKSPKDGLAAFRAYLDHVAQIPKPV